MLHSVRTMQRNHTNGTRESVRAHNDGEKCLTNESKKSNNALIYNDTLLGQHQFGLRCESR